MKNDPSSPIRARSRLICGLAMAFVIWAGLGLRSGTIPLPHLMAKYGGDALWATMVYFGIGLLFPKLAALRVAIMAMFVATGVEFSQLYHAPWIDAVRSTRLGALAIGSTFNWPDFLAYAVGVGVGIVAEGLSGVLTGRHLHRRNDE